MKIERIRELLERRPWKPLDFVLDNGERIPVRHPETIFIIADREIAVVSNERIHWFGPEAVSLIEERRPKRGKSRRS